SLAKTVHERREQLHTLRLNEHLDAFNPAVNQVVLQGQEYFLRATGDPVHSRQMAIDVLEKARTRQAMSLAFFDIFFVLAVVGLGVMLLILMMQRSVAEKGAHVAAE